ncbi:histone PARylation factor 1-like isoform X2 [Acropora palmata]|uniref:histone PARylation factor 1-like isoform X2 n=1 Tax=Acropora palmata TaxID=6131 RepID=UPI003D9FD013
MADEVRSPEKKRRKTEKTPPERKDKDHDEKFVLRKQELVERFKVEFPKDFFDFWEFCKKLNLRNPCGALNELLGLNLVGPYDVLSGAYDDIEDSNITSYHLHWRYFYDPPEFLTVIRGDDKTGYHMGYYRDDPKSPPVFVASNQAEKNCEFTVLGENLFAAVNKFVGDFLKTSSGKSKLKSLKTLQGSLVSEADKLKYNLNASTTGIKARNKKVVSKTFHKAGIIVPVDTNEVGYRPLTVTDGELKKILKQITDDKSTGKDKEQASENLQEQITLVQFANDECDYGMGLELALDMFCFGSERFHNAILQLLPLAYKLLGRDLFAEIAEIHVNNRSRAQLSQLPS